MSYQSGKNISNPAKMLLPNCSHQNLACKIVSAIFFLNVTATYFPAKSNPEIAHAICFFLKMVGC
jgi:hypothetical protein